MRKLSRAQWEEKYIAGPVEQFDQKYTMFNRPGWDPEVRGLVDDWSFAGEARDRPGYTLLEHALRRSSQRATQLALFNIYKPNPSPISKALLAAMAGGRPRPQGAAGQPRQQGWVSIGDRAEMTRAVKKVALYSGADLVGVCRLDRRWLYSHTYEGAGFDETRGSEQAPGSSRPQVVPEEFQYAVVMAFEMPYAMIKYAPTYIADAATGMGYSRMAIANAHLAAFLRGLGFKSIDCSTNDVALSVPLAMLAGLGDLGRNGLLVTPQFGPRVRLSKVLTDLPLVPDAPVDFGVTEFCSVCKKCAERCPSQAIMTGDRAATPNNVSNAAGELKWPLDAEKCRVYWARTSKSCTLCIACCPYNKPHTLFHRAVRWLTDRARWAAPFYVWADDLLGYGRPASPETFWEEWQPKRV